jgi:hypothetical protein
MSPAETEQLVGEVVQISGCSPPPLLEDDSPTLREQAGDGQMYLIGLIGGKEVGKSALVNALVGEKITDETSHGPGTQAAVAYVHRSHVHEVKDLLDRAVPGKYRIVAHDHDRLARQVLVDLPDIDSRFTQHVEVTRAMLRHMLFPIWIQSVEKYADAQPQKLLARVAAGNDPKNFLFCLNKADQLPVEDGLADQLRTDFARRLAGVLSLDEPPRVFLISAIHPGQFDLPEVKNLLSREKSADVVSESRRLAGRRRMRSMLSWLDRQDLPGRAAGLRRLDEQASELLAQRLGVPLMESTVPAVLDDAAYRTVMTDAAFDRRVARWPIVNVLHMLLSPLLLLVRRNSSASFFGGAEALVDAHLSAGPSLTESIQSAFAQLQQSNPAVAGLYQRKKLWEGMEAAAAAARLRADLIETVNRQREIVLSRLSGRRGVIAPLVRVLLTIGALLWFPIVQPVLSTVLAGGSTLHSLSDAAIVLVTILSAQLLLMNTALLLLWYLMIWSLLRWNAGRRVAKLLSRWKTAEQADPSLNLSTQTLAWIESLLEPIHSARVTVEKLAERAEFLRAELK